MWIEIQCTPPPWMPLTFRRYLFLILFTLCEEECPAVSAGKASELDSVPMEDQDNGNSLITAKCAASGGRTVSPLSLSPIITPSPQTVILYYYPRSLFLCQELLPQQMLILLSYLSNLVGWATNSASIRKSECWRPERWDMVGFSKGPALWSSCAKL